MRSPRIRRKRKRKMCSSTKSIFLTPTWTLMQRQVDCLKLEGQKEKKNKKED